MSTLLKLLIGVRACKDCRAAGEQRVCGDVVMMSPYIGWFSLLGLLSLLLLAVRSSPDGIRSLWSLRFWSLPFGAVIPGLIFLLAVALGSSHEQLGEAIEIGAALVLAQILASGVFSLYLRTPVDVLRRFVIGLVSNSGVAVAGLVFAMVPPF